MLGETITVGRLRYWDVRRLLKSYDSSWATKYARDHVFTGGGPRCWPEFGLQWARENGFVPVRVQPGDPCAFQYPFLYLSKPCKAGALLVNSLF